MTKTPGPKPERHTVISILFVYRNLNPRLEFHHKVVIVHCNLINHPSDQGFAVLGDFSRLTLQESNHVSHALADAVLVGFLQKQFFLFCSEFINLIDKGIIVLLCVYHFQEFLLKSQKAGIDFFHSCTVAVPKASLKTCLQSGDEGGTARDDFVHRPDNHLMQKFLLYGSCRAGWTVFFHPAETSPNCGLTPTVVPVDSAEDVIAVGTVHDA